MGLINRPGALIVSVAIVVAACTSSGTSPTTDIGTTTSTTLGEPASTVSQDATSTTGAPVTTGEPLVTTSSPARQLFEYAVVAEERSRRIAIIDPAIPCLNNAGMCELAPILTVELPEGPHNLTGVGSVVYATHPYTGFVSRIDVATGDVLTAAVGIEPHDIERATTEAALYVTDEAGRQLLTIDAETLAVIEAVDLPGEAHNLVVVEGAIWVTLVGRGDLARVIGNQVDLFSTSGSPHDLIVDQNGLIWFSNWGSDVLNTFDPGSGDTSEAPSGVSEPHHFAIAPDGAVWVSDNGGAAVVGFGVPPVTVEVGPIPHHLGFVGATLVVAVSGSGQAVLIKDGQVVARSQLTSGLHGVAVVELMRPLAVFD